MIAVGFLSSGEGLGFQTVLDSCAAGELAASVVVLAAEKICPAILRAEAAGVPVIFHAWGPYKVAGKLRETYDRDLAARLQMHGVEYVLLDGWERELTPEFEAAFTGRILDLGSPIDLGQQEGICSRVRAALARAGH